MLDPTTGHLRVVVVEAQRMPREALVGTLSASSGVSCTGLAQAEALTDVPDVVVVAAHGSGLDLAGAVGAARRAGALRIVALGAFIDGVLIERLRAEGASAVLSTDCSIAELIASVHGEAPPDAADIVAASHRSVIARAAAMGVTPRQHEVLRHLAAGGSPQQIARQLDIALSTCRDHLKALRTSLDCRSTTELVVAAAQLGILPEVGRAGRR